MVKQVRYRSRRRWLVAVGVSCAVLVLFVGGIIWAARSYYYTNLKPVSSSQTATIVTIPEGTTVSDIASLLKKHDLIRDPRIFTQYVRNQNQQDKLQAGTYSLRPSQSVKEIVGILSGGNILKKLFTVLPGQRIDQVKSAMINAGFDANEVEAAFNPDLYKNHSALVDKPAGASLEGYLYPNSYQKITSTKPQTIIQQALDEMQKHLTPAVRAGFAAQRLTVHQGIALASAVEMEVSKPADRPIVAQVFLKRLSIGMKLESDAITTYGDVLAGHAPSTSFDTPYNVYIHPGLPVGPISNVSDSSLAAVISPASTDWLYFVSDPDGNTYFSRTDAEHQALVRQHCKELCQ